METDNNKTWLDEMIQRQTIPLTLREETVAEFCEKWGIYPSLYYYHLYKKENQEKILEIVLSKAKTAVPDILEKLIEKAKEGDMKAIDIYLDSVAKLAKNLDIKTDGRPIYGGQSIGKSIQGHDSDSQDI